jgi:N-acetyl-D-muramate 6-phosphate phosphatase
LSDFQGIFFDLDGTLIDSAPDLGAAADRMRVKRGLPSLPLDHYRHMAGAGARGMLHIAFGMQADHPDFMAYREEFFTEYESAMCDRTVIFDGVQQMLGQLNAKGQAWGIVTNKMERFTLPLLAQLPSLHSAHCVVGGDTTAHAKPHPEPLFEACRRAQRAPQHCVYVGDDERDIQAGRAAGMVTVAATYGYLGERSDVSAWQADVIVDSVQDLMRYLKLD